MYPASKLVKHMFFGVRCVHFLHVYTNTHTHTLKYIHIQKRNTVFRKKKDWGITPANCLFGYSIFKGSDTKIPQHQLHDKKLIFDILQPINGFNLLFPNIWVLIQRVELSPLKKLKAEIASRQLWKRRVKRA